DGVTATSLLHGRTRLPFARTCDKSSDVAKTRPESRFHARSFRNSRPVRRACRVIVRLKYPFGTLLGWSGFNDRNILGHFAAIPKEPQFFLGNPALKIVENYDTQGRHINSLIEKDGVKSKTDYVYDDNGRLCGYFHYERDNNLREKADYIYNAHGELI